MKQTIQAKVIDLRYLIAGLTQNYGKTNRKGREGHEGKRVSESSCVSPKLITLVFS